MCPRNGVSGGEFQELEQKLRIVKNKNKHLFALVLTARYNITACSHAFMEVKICGYLNDRLRE